MTARLYVKRGGAASAETEVMLAAADRKGSPVFDGTTPKVNLGMRYADGESSQGTYVLTDPLAEIPSDTYRIPPHGLVTLTEDASGDELWLARVRNSQISAGRRAVSVPKNEVEWEVTTVDCNIDLTGNHFVHPWERPAETDIDRIIALQAHILNGDSSTAAHHRKSTVITAATVGDGHLLQDGTTHTDDSLTNLEAKTYPPGTVARDVLEDISEAAGKTYGVVIHHTGGTSHLCLLYVQELDHETYDSAIKISQNIADWNPDDPDTPVFEPWWDRGPGKQIENDHVISGLIDIYGGTADNPLTVFVDQSADDETPHEYWTDAYFDSDSKTEAQATFRANQILASRRPPGHTTHQLSIKMHPEQTRLLCAGMSVSVKSAVVTGAPLSYVKRRVSELRWELAPDGDWFAHLDLDRPIRVRRGSINRPSGPAPGTPEVPPTPGTTDLSILWDYEEGNNKDTTGTYSFLDYTTNSNLVRQGAGCGWCAPTLTRESTRIACAAGKTVTVSFRAGAQTAHELQTRKLGIDYYDGAGAPSSFYSDTINIPPSSAGGGPVAIVSTSFVAPTGTVELQLSTSHGVYFDNIALDIGTPGTPGTPAVPSTDLPAGYVVGSGDGFFGDSDIYIPVGSALEHQYISGDGLYHDADQIAIDDVGGFYTGTDVEAALQELAGGGVVAVDSTTTVDPASTIRVPDGGIDDAGGGEARLRVLLNRGGGRDLLATTTSAGSTSDLDLSIANVYDLALDDDCTLSFSNPPATDVRGRWTIILRQDATGSRTVTWPAEVVWRDTDGTPTTTAPDLATAANAVDVVILTTLDGGASYGAALDNGSSGDPALGGDLSGTASAASVDAVKGVVVTDAGTTGDVLTKTGALTATWSTPSSSSGIGPILISDTPSTPLVFADLIQNEAQDDLVYADP